MLVGIPSNATNIANTLIKNQNGRVKLNEIEKLMEKMNHYKYSGMKVPLNELSFLISPGLNHLGINLCKCKNKTKALYFNTVLSTLMATDYNATFEQREITLKIALRVIVYIKNRIISDQNWRF